MAAGRSWCIVVGLLSLLVASAVDGAMVSFTAPKYTLHVVDGQLCDNNISLEGVNSGVPVDVVVSPKSGTGKYGEDFDVGQSNFKLSGTLDVPIQIIPRSKKESWDFYLTLNCDHMMCQYQEAHVTVTTVASASGWVGFQSPLFHGFVNDPLQIWLTKNGSMQVDVTIVLTENETTTAPAATAPATTAPATTAPATTAPATTAPAVEAPTNKTTRNLIPSHIKPESQDVTFLPLDTVKNAQFIISKSGTFTVHLTSCVKVGKPAQVEILQPLTVPGVQYLINDLESNVGQLQARLAGQEIKYQQQIADQEIKYQQQIADQEIKYQKQIASLENTTNMYTRVVKDALKLLQNHTIPSSVGITASPTTGTAAPNTSSAAPTSSSAVPPASSAASSAAPPVASPTAPPVASPTAPPVASPTATAPSASPTTEPTVDGADTSLGEEDITSGEGTTTPGVPSGMNWWLALVALLVVLGVAVAGYVGYYNRNKLYEYVTGKGGGGGGGGRGGRRKHYRRLPQSVHDAMVHND